MTLIANLAITNYRCQGLINLPAIRNDIINFQPSGLHGNSVNLVLQHLVDTWVSALKRIWYKADTLCWFYITRSGWEWLIITEYVPKGLLPECLFLLNHRGVHEVATY